MKLTSNTCSYKILLCPVILNSWQLIRALLEAFRMGVIQRLHGQVLHGLVLNR